MVLNWATHMVNRFVYFDTRMIILNFFFAKDYDGQNKSEKLSHIIVVLFGVGYCNNVYIFEKSNIYL